jgi:hypothetical protein
MQFGLFNQLFKIFGWIHTLFLVLIPVVVILMLVPSPWSWIWLGLSAIIISFGVYIGWRRRRLSPNVIEIQQRAQALTQASRIGSALHVAGHPLLTRDQPIVLTLQDQSLSFYTYDSSVPVDTLPITQIKSLFTVIYDDERVPHIEVIDTAAQALQVTFEWEHETWTCLFRQMRKVRPIDWYHAIQQARLPINKGSYGA